MLKYLYCKEVFREVPDEISLGISISNCQIRCYDCNQKELWRDVGVPLSDTNFIDLINRHRGITCVLFMGSGQKEYTQLNHLAGLTRELGYKVAVYLGEDTIPSDLDKHLFDYIKIGHWNPEKGGLDSPTTNQKMYFLEHQEDGTYKKTCINYKFLKQNED